MKKILNIYLILLLIVLVELTFSQKVATTSMQFLKVMPCARATALGDAYTALAYGVEGIFWNPAGLALTQNQEFSTTYINWIFDTQQGALAYALPIQSLGVFGLQIQYVDYGEFEEAVLTRPAIKQLPEPGLTGRTFNPYSFLFGVAYAVNLTDRFSTGIAAKYAYEALFSEKKVSVINESKGIYENVNTYGNVLLFDFGLHYKTGFKSIELGASIQNFGSQVKYALEENSAPMQFRVGIAANVIGPSSLLNISENNRIGLSVDLFHPNDYDQQAHLGIEYEFANMIALRAGYKYNYDSEKFSLGTGLHHTIGNIKYSFDYSYNSLGKYLGNTHRISLGIGIL